MRISTFCIVAGVIFIAIGVWGFISGDRVLIFHVNPAHNIVHITSGALAVACGLIGNVASRTYAILFGMVYGAVSILGFAGYPPLVELLHLNDADNVLHLFVALAFLSAGIASLKPRPQLVRVVPY